VRKEQFLAGVRCIGEGRMTTGKVILIVGVMMALELVYIKQNAGYLLGQAVASETPAALAGVASSALIDIGTALQGALS
jgi:hypothetical protein